MKQLGIKTILLFSLVLLVSASDSFAKGDAPKPKKEKKEKKGKDGRGVPLDGGASILLAAGAAYGLKRLKDKRNMEA